MPSLDITRLRKTVSATAFVLALLFSSTVITQCVRFASAQTILITITPDGDVSPSTALIQRFGDLYILTSDVIGTEILVQRSNITLDGNGHTIQGEPRLPTRWGGESSSGGIGLGRVQNVTVKNFSINECATGIGLFYCSNIIISDNNISRTWHPIMFNAISAAINIMDGDYNIITGNRFENNIVGINLWNNSNQNVIVGNTISGSTHEGIRLSDSSGNTFYHNNFENAKNVYDDTFDHYGFSRLSTNSWDNGEEGNFWNDYNGTDADGDGIGDTPHKLYFMNQDDYPLMKPWEPTPIDNTPPIISMFSPENTTYTVNSVLLNFSTNEPVSWLGYSLDGQENVTITGNTTLSGLTSGLHNITVYATDAVGNTGTSETVWFTIAEPEPFTATWVAASAIIAAVASAGILIYLRRNKRRNQAQHG